MNALVKATTTVTMTSLELVAFINSQRKHYEAVLRHDSFMAKVPKVLSETGLQNFLDTYVHPQNGQTYPCYRFKKREACLMAMSYSYDLQASVFDRMTALEEAQKKTAISLPDFTDPAEAAIAWAEQYKEKQLFIAQVEALKPKAIALDRIADTKDLFGIREAAKALKIKQNELTNMLVKRQWAYRSNDNRLQGYATAIDRGYLSHVVTAPQHDSKGVEHVYQQLKVTAKGVARLSQIISKVGVVHV